MGACGWSVNVGDVWQAGSTMAAMTADEALGKVLLVTGAEDLFKERAVLAARHAVRKHDSSAEATEVSGEDLVPGRLEEEAGPSLFASTRCLVVTGLESVEQAVADEICAYAERPEMDVCLVLVHSGGQKGVAVLNRLRKLPAVTEAKFDRLKEREIPGFVASEAHSHGSRIDAEAASDLVAAVGPDLRALASAVDQLVSDHPEEPLTPAVVRNYFAGRAEVKGYVISDLAFAGRAEEALGELRWAFGAGTAPVLIVGSFASTARTLARLIGAPRGLRDADLAQEIGAQPWKLRQLRALARGWDPVRMANAINAIARADAEVKGEAVDKSYALERMVLAVSTGRA